MGGRSGKTSIMTHVDTDQSIFILGGQPPGAFSNFQVMVP